MREISNAISPLKNARSNAVICIAVDVSALAPAIVEEETAVMVMVATATKQKCDTNQNVGGPFPLIMAHCRSNRDHQNMLHVTPIRTAR